jgi:hypothetical protein
MSITITSEEVLTWQPRTESGAAGRTDRRGKVTWSGRN